MSDTIATIPEKEAPADGSDGFGCLTSAKGTLPLVSLSVRATLEGLVAETAIRQTFVNAWDERIEAVYLFPLPDHAAVRSFRLRIGDRTIAGTLQERGAARAAYQEAIHSGRRAALMEEDRPNVFTMSVGNIGPREEVDVEIDLCGPVHYSEGEATFRFPLVVAPRYIPGIPLPGESVGAGWKPDTDLVPDASRISPPVLLPGFPNPIALDLQVDLAALALPTAKIRSSLHEIEVETADGAVQSIRLRAGERLNRDFILRLALGGESLQSNCLISPDETGTGGTFSLTILPPVASRTGPESRKPRDVVLLLDRSGSMSGQKIVIARRALARMIDTLGERDRFRVYFFDDRLEPAGGTEDQGLRPASDRNRFLATEALAKVEARGGTDITPALLEALKAFRDPPQADGPERERILVLVTDGQVGNEDSVLRSVRQMLQTLSGPAPRFYVLGIDQAVNDGVLNRLSQLGHGACELVESDDRLDEVLTRIHRRLSAPIVTGLEILEEGWTLEPESLVPRTAPDLFEGSPVQILGRYSGAIGQQMTVRGQTSEGAAWQCRVTPVLAQGRALPLVWARQQVRWLEDEYAVSPSSALEQRIVGTSLRHGVLCRFTAYVAVDESAPVDAEGKPRTIVQAVEPPAGWDEVTSSPLAPPMSVRHRLSEPLFGEVDFAASYLNVQFSGIKLPFRSKGRKSRPARSERDRADDGKHGALELLAWMRRTNRSLAAKRPAGLQRLSDRLQTYLEACRDHDALDPDWLLKHQDDLRELGELRERLGPMLQGPSDPEAPERKALLEQIRTVLARLAETDPPSGETGGSDRPPRRKKFWG